MKKLIKLVLLLAAVTALLCLFAVHSSATTYSGSCGDSVNWSLDTETGVLEIAGSGEMYDYYYYDNFDLSNSAPWYSYRDNIESVTIQSGVKRIGNFAFWDCENLRGITLSNSITSIGYAAFSGCDSLKKITIPSSVTIIENSAFYKCDSLKSIKIPSSVTSIGEAAFLYCNSLTSVTISSGVTSIDGSSFAGCKKLTNISVNSGNSYYSSVSGVLFNKSKKALITYPAGKKDTSYTIPGSVTNIETYAFNNCDSLKNIKIPNSVTSIGNAAFSGCDSLTSIKIPGSVKSIADDTFYSCDSLTSITIPSSVKNIGEWAFSECDSLRNIKIPGSVKSIGEAAFFDCNSLTSVTISSGVTSIGYNAFCDCKSLKNITIPSSVTSIGALAFNNCDSLTSIKIPSSVTSIGDGAFYSCDSLTNVIIQSGVTSIDGGAFCDCNSLTSITIPSSVTNIEGHAFESHGSLKYVFYGGSKAQWDSIVAQWDSIVFLGSNEDLTSAAIHYNATDHTYQTKSLTKATQSKDGKTTKVCSVCNYSKTSAIKKIASVKLNKAKLTYTGKAQTVTVTVKDSAGKALKLNTDYTVSGNKNTKVGKYTVTVKFKGNYSVTKTLSYEIVPGKVTGLKATQTTSTITLTWSKVTGATSYNVYSYNSKTKKYTKVAGVKTNKATIKSLKAGTGYKYAVKAYISSTAGSLSSVISTATKTKTPSITSLKAGSKSATVKWSNVSGENGYQVYYATSKNGSYKKGATTKANDVDATIKKLTKGKTYYFKVRAYKTADSGTVYSAWSAVKSVKVK